MRMYFEVPISASLIDEPEFDLQALLVKECRQAAQVREADPDTGFEYPIEAYRVVELTGPHERGVLISAPWISGKVYAATVEREE